MTGLSKETACIHVQELKVILLWVPRSSYICSSLIVITVGILLSIQVMLSSDPQLRWNFCLGPHSRGLSFRAEYSKGEKMPTAPLKSWIKHAGLLAKIHRVFLCGSHGYDFTFFLSYFFSIKCLRAWQDIVFALQTQRKASGFNLFWLQWSIHRYIFTLSLKIMELIR